MSIVSVMLVIHLPCLHRTSLMHGVLYPRAETAGIKSAQGRCVGVTAIRLTQRILFEPCSCAVEIRGVKIYYSFTDPTTSLSNRATFNK